MLVHRQDVDRIAVLTLNNPPANGYSHAMHRELDAHVLDVRMDPAIDVIVIRGAGDRFFCAGADIAYLQSLEPEQKYAFCLHANETLLRLEHTPKLVIAALNGHCVGGGLEIALACDLRVGRESGAKPNLVGMPEVALGVLPGTGGTQRLSRILGRASALRFMVEGRNVPVEEALTLGLVHAVLPEDDWWQEVLKYARSFCAPHKAAGAVGLIKRAVVSGADLPLESGLALERELQQRLFTSPDAKEGVAAFLGKRPPTFSGRPVPGAPAESPGGGGERGESGATAAAGPSTAPAASSSPSGGGGPAPRNAPRSSPDRAPAPAAVASTGITPLSPSTVAALVQGVPAGSVFDEGGPRETTEPPPPPPPEVDLAHIYIDDAVLDLLPTWLVRQHLVIPVRLEGDVLLVAMLDPGNEKALAAMKEHTGLDIRGLRADEEALLMRYTMHYRL